MKILASGWRGQVFIENDNGIDYCIKKALDDTKKAAINKEIQIIQKLNINLIGFVPKIVEYGDGWFKYPYIKGISFHKYLKNTSKIKSQKLVIDLLNKCYELDKIGIIHGELIRPTSNVLVNNDQIFIIDFERGSFGDFSGKNMRSYAQWLTSNGFIDLHIIKSLGKIKDAKSVYELIISNMKINKNYLLFYISLFVLIDQITKYFFYDKNLFNYLWIINPALNKGIAWSLPLHMNIIVLLSFLALIMFFILYKKSELSKIVYILLVSGTVGNLIDRLVYNGVRDFLDFHYWPIFNIADCLIFFGVAIYLFYIKSNTN